MLTGFTSVVEIESFKLREVRPLQWLHWSIDHLEMWFARRRYCVLVVRDVCQPWPRNFALSNSGICIVVHWCLLNSAEIHSANNSPVHHVHSNQGRDARDEERPPLDEARRPTHYLSL